MYYVQMCLCFVRSGVDDEDTDTGRFWAGGELGVFALLPIRDLICPCYQCCTDPNVHQSRISFAAAMHSLVDCSSKSLNIRRGLLLLI